MSEPKYPEGTLLRHRASGQLAIVTDAKVCFAGMDEEYFSYTLEADMGKVAIIDGAVAVDLRYEPANKPDPSENLPVDDLLLPTRACNCLDNLGIETIGQLTQVTASQLLACRNFGEWSLRSVREILAIRGLYLKHEQQNS